MNNKSSPGVTTGIRVISQNCKASLQAYVIKKKKVPKMKQARSPTLTYITLALTKSGLVHVIKYF